MTISGTGAGVETPLTEKQSKSHFLLLSAARQGSVLDFGKISEDQAFEMFRQIRWCDTYGEPVCPYCQCTAAYDHWQATNRKNAVRRANGLPEKKLRRIFTCQACLRQFSVTSGTTFHSRKMEMRTLLASIFSFACGVKGEAALFASRLFNLSPKASFYLLHKMREAMSADQDQLKLSGTVEVDGIYIGQKQRNLNDRIKQKERDRRTKAWQNPKRRVGIVMRERGGRTLTFVGKTEGHGVPEVLRKIHPESTVHVDEAPSWKPLEWSFRELRIIDHSKAFSKDGACTNQAESFNSRIRRAEIGIYHHISGCNLDTYLKELATREDLRRISTGTFYLTIALACADAPPSKRYSNKWRGRNRGRKPTGFRPPPQPLDDCIPF